MKRCIQCGREGARGFRHYPATVVAMEGTAFTIPAFDECLGKVACRRRQPRAARIHDSTWD